MKAKLQRDISRLAKGAILLDQIESYPYEIISVFNQFHHNFERIKSHLVDNEFWYEESYINDYFYDSDLYHKINDVLTRSNFDIVFYHTSRLLPFEIEQIKKKGFLKTTSNMLKEKVRLAEENGYFSVNEAEYLITHLLNHTQNPHGLIYCYTNFSFLLVDSQTKMRINSWWGGESISWYYNENSSTDFEKVIIDKLQRIGTPSVIVLSQRYNNLYSIFDSMTLNSKCKVIHLMILFYISNFFNLDFNTDNFGELNFSPIPKIVDVIPLYDIHSS